MVRNALICGLAAGIALAHGIITTVVGTDTVFQDIDQPATRARIGRSQGVLLTPDGTVYLSDPDHLEIYKVSADGIIRVIAGNGIRGFSGDGGPATGAGLSAPAQIAMDSKGNLC